MMGGDVRGVEAHGRNKTFTKISTDLTLLWGKPERTAPLEAELNLDLNNDSIVCRAA